MSFQKKKMHADFAFAVFKRDKFKCVFCPATENLDAHHITDRNLMPNGGYVKENGITLCPNHHEMAEVFHVTGGETWQDDMHPFDLYKKIGSSYELAVVASRKLK